MAVILLAEKRTNPLFSMLLRAICSSSLVALCTSKYFEGSTIPSRYLYVLPVLYHRTILSDRDREH